MESVVNFIVNYQLVIFVSLGILIALAIYLIHAPLESMLTHISMPVVRWIEIGAATISVVTGLVTGTVQPIPKDFGIDFVPDLYCQHANSNRLIIFLHGWRGDDTTWRNFPDLVCADKRFKNADVHLLNYPTFLFARNLRISQLSRSFNNDLDAWDAFGRYDKIAMITHSMGGTIARKMAVLSGLERKRDVPIGLIVSVASPYLGADPHKIVKVLGLEPRLIERWLQRLGFSPGLADELIPGSSFITSLADEWEAFIEHPINHCLFSPQDKVVSEASAKNQCESTDMYRQGGHREIVKPRRHDDRRYELPMRRVAAYFDEPGEVSR